MTQRWRGGWLGSGTRTQDPLSAWAWSMHGTAPSHYTTAWRLLLNAGRHWAGHRLRRLEGLQGRRQVLLDVVTRLSKIWRRRWPGRKRITVRRGTGKPRPQWRCAPWQVLTIWGPEYVSTDDVAYRKHL